MLDRRHADMLTRLQQLHAEMFAALAESEALAAGAVPDSATLSRVRWNLTRAGIDLRRFHEEELYPVLLRLRPDGGAAAVWTVRAEGKRLRAIARDHLECWPIDRVACDWAGYGRDSRDLRRAIRLQVGAERSVLYPLLALLGEEAGADVLETEAA